MSMQVTWLLQFSPENIEKNDVLQAQSNSDC